MLATDGLAIAALPLPLRTREYDFKSF
eukprot:COSAG01_NODE_42693_length_437_cov_1.479290_1_plen_26_part_01